MINLFRLLLIVFLCGLVNSTYAQGSGAMPLTLGFLSSATTGTSGCITLGMGNPPCFVPYSTTNPLPTTTSGSVSSLTLTTTGTSGPAVLSGSNLNIPVYTAAGGGLSSLNFTTTNGFSATFSGTTTGVVVAAPSAGGAFASSSNNLGFFSATSSAQLAGVVSDETGTGALVFAGSPTFTGTVLGAAATFSGTLAGLAVTTTTLTVNGNASLTGTTTANNLTVTGTCTGCGSGGSGTVGSSAANQVAWYSALGTTVTGNASLTVTSTGVLTGAEFIPTSSTIPTDGLYLPSSNTSGIADRSLPVASFTNPASSVNYLTFTGAVTGVSPAISMGGTDTSGAGLGVRILGLAASTTGTGGPITITGGIGAGGSSGGVVNITGGAGSGNLASGGQVTIQSGASVSPTAGVATTIAGGITSGGSGGQLNLNGGAAGGNGTGGRVVATGANGSGGSGANSGGAIVLTGGNGATGNTNTGTNGGAITATAGNAGTNATGGAIILLSGNGGSTNGVAGSINLTLGTTTSTAGGVLPWINAGGPLAFTTTRAVDVGFTGIHSQLANSLALSTTGTDRVTIDPTGLVALPSITSDATHTTATVCEDTTTHALYSGSGTVGICLGTSSVRYKEHISPIVTGLDKIKEFKPINYYYIKGHGDDGAKEQFGFLAEDVYQVEPRLVGLDSEGRPNNVDLVGMIPLMVDALRTQQEELDVMHGAFPFHKCFFGLLVCPN